MCDIIIIQIKKGQPQGWKGGKDENSRATKQSGQAWV